MVSLTHGLTVVSSTEMYTWDKPYSFLLLLLHFPTLISPQITWIYPFPCLWFLPYTSHNKHFAISKCSSPVFHNVSLCSQAATPLSPKGTPALTHLDMCHSWRLRLSPGSSSGRGPEKMLISLGPCCGRWVSPATVAPRTLGLVKMDLWWAGGSWERSYEKTGMGTVWAPIHHSLSVVLCGCAQELLARNLTNTAVSTHAIISLKIPVKTLMKRYPLELLHSMQSAL